MRKSITLNYNIINRIQSKIDTRENIEQFIMHFLMKFGIAYEVLKVLEKNVSKKDYLDCAVGQHIVSLVSNMETLLRDIFIFIVNEMPEYQDLITKEYKLKIKGKFEKGDSYVLAEMINFQNINDIESAFKLLFNNKEFFEEIGNLVVPIYNLQEKAIENFSLNKSFINWLEYLNHVIETRHKIVHDSHFAVDISINTIKTYQKCILYFSQIFSMYIIHKFQLPVLVIEYNKDEKPIPYFLSLDDFNLKWKEVK